MQAIIDHLKLDPASAALVTDWESVAQAVVDEALAFSGNPGPHF